MDSPKIRNFAIPVTLLSSLIVIMCISHPLLYMKILMKEWRFVRTIQFWLHITFSSNLPMYLSVPRPIVNAIPKIKAAKQHRKRIDISQLLILQESQWQVGKEEIVVKSTRHCAMNQPKAMWFIRPTFPREKKIIYILSLVIGHQLHIKKNERAANQADRTLPTHEPSHIRHAIFHTFRSRLN